MISHILHPHLKLGHDAGAARGNKRAGSGAEQNHGSALAVTAMLEKRGCNRAPQTPALLHLTQGGRCGRAVPPMSDSPHQASSPPFPTLSPRHQIQVIFPQILLPRLPMTAQPHSLKTMATSLPQDLKWLPPSLQPPPCQSQPGPEDFSLDSSGQDPHCLIFCLNSDIHLQFLQDYLCFHIFRFSIVEL